MLNIKISYENVLRSASAELKLRRVIKYLSKKKKNLSTKVLKFQ